MLSLVRSPGHGLLVFWHVSLLACWPSGMPRFWPSSGLLRGFFGSSSGLLLVLVLRFLWPTAGLALLLAHCWPCASSGPLLALRFFWPTAGLALLLAHCWSCASSGPLLALRFFWPAGLLAFYGPSSSLLWTCFGPSLGLFRTFFGSSSGLPRTCFGPSLDCALLAKPWPSGALAFFRFVGPSVTSAVCGTGDVYEALAEERGSLPEHGASRLEHFPLVREIASPGKVSWAWPGVSPGPESRVTPLLLRPQLPTGPFSS
jgi:hypothetical protein